MADKDLPWAKRPKKSPPWKGTCRSDFHHAELNADRVSAATDGHTDGEMFVYRYKRSPANWADEDKE